jgi:hypothetical protein
MRSSRTTRRHAHQRPQQPTEYLAHPWTSQRFVSHVSRRSWRDSSPTQPRKARPLWVHRRPQAATARPRARPFSQVTIGGGHCSAGARITHASTGPATDAALGPWVGDTRNSVDIALSPSRMPRPFPCLLRGSLHGSWRSLRHAPRSLRRRGESLPRRSRRHGPRRWWRRAGQAAPTGRSLAVRHRQEPCDRADGPPPSASGHHQGWRIFHKGIAKVGWAIRCRRARGQPCPARARAERQRGRCGPARDQRWAETRAANGPRRRRARGGRQRPPRARTHVPRWRSARALAGRGWHPVQQGHMYLAGARPAPSRDAAGSWCWSGEGLTPTCAIPLWKMRPPWW